MKRTTFEVYWNTKTAKSNRFYSRFFSKEADASAFLEGKRKPSTYYGFVREIAVTYDERGRADEIKFVRLVNVIVNF